MKISLHWLREWVDIDESSSDSVAALAHALTMAGLEIEGVESVVAPMSGLVVADIVSVERHPDAEKLSVCRVHGGSETLQIVCGAPNVRAGMKAILAQVGAVLPDGKTIGQAKLRGIESFGMLCSAREIGIHDESSGLMELPAEFVAGTNVVNALALDDRVLEVNLTPNRGDCMSVAGIAREVAAISNRDVHAPVIKPVPAQIDATFPVQLDASNACRKFASRVIRGVRGDQLSPFWLRERLRRAGLRSINLLVDVTNYVMLELGQPMHAYDLAKLHGNIVVRMARADEKLTLLDGRSITLTPDVLVIADQNNVLGMAGVMGGEASGISAGTTDIVLEVAHFDPNAIAGRGRRYGLVTDASQRFERGVDPNLPTVAIERATQLIIDYSGGQAGQVMLVESAPSDGHSLAPIQLRHSRVEKVLGIKIDSVAIASYLQKLGMKLQVSADGWLVTPPSWRFDLTIEADLIEEVARLHGYDRIPAIDADVAQPLREWTETSVRVERAADLLVDRGYQEAITYSFVDPAWQRIIFPNEEGIALLNPISAELAVMRLSLWPGLALAARENLRRQQSRVRLFEVGRKFSEGKETEVIGGLTLGSALPEQWDAPVRKLDFFDIKSDVEALLQLSGDIAAFKFEAAHHAALHPGQSARIFRDSQPIGWVGAMHPEIAKQLDLTYPAYVFELDAPELLLVRLPQFSDISRYPAIRRDIAVIVEENVNLDRLRSIVTASAGDLLRTLVVLSVYRGEPINKGKKSIALGLNLQDTSRTLTDDDADRIMTRVMDSLREQVGAAIRDK